MSTSLTFTNRGFFFLFYCSLICLFFVFFWGGDVLVGWFGLARSLVLVVFFWCGFFGFWFVLIWFWFVGCGWWWFLVALFACLRVFSIKKIPLFPSLG